MSEEPDVYTPEFVLKVGGEEVTPSTGLIIEVIVSQYHDGPDYCRIVLDNKDNYWSGDKDVSIGGAVEFSVGISGEGAQNLFKGEIVGIEVFYHEFLPARYTIRAYDKMHRLTRAKKTKTWLDVKDSDMASEIAGQHGLGSDVEDTQFVQKFVIQHNQTDYEFLRWRAWRLGMEVDCVDEKLVFKKPDLGGSKVAEIELEKNLSRARIVMSTGWQRKKQEVRGWDPEQKKEFKGTAQAGDEWAQMGSTSGPEESGAHGDYTDILVNIPVGSQEEIDAIAKAHLNIHAMDYGYVELESRGDQKIRARTVVEVKGIGTRFSGNYYVTWARHRLIASHGPGKGYTTVIKGIRTHSG